MRSLNHSLEDQSSEDIQALLRGWGDFVENGADLRRTFVGSRRGFKNSRLVLDIRSLDYFFVLGKSRVVKIFRSYCEVWVGL